MQEPEPELSGGSVERPGTPQGAVSRGPFSSSSEQPSASSTPLSTLSGGSCVACYGMRLPGQLAGLQLGQLLGSGACVRPSLMLRTRYAQPGGPSCATERMLDAATKLTQFMVCPQTVLSQAPLGVCSGATGAGAKWR